MKELKIRTNKAIFPLFIFGLCFFGGIIVFISCIIFSSMGDNPSKETILMALILIGVLCGCIGLALLLVAYLSFGKLTVSEKGIRYTSFMRKAITYSWDEIKSCGIDFLCVALRDNKMMYISKKEVPILNYNAKSYICNQSMAFWDQFVRDQGVYWSIKKQNNLVVRFEVTEKEITAFKNFLPAHLLAQLEETEARMYAENPKMKPIK